MSPRASHRSAGDQGRFPLRDLRHAHGRFARSVNVERDTHSASDVVHGYLPTGRSVDALTRVARALRDGGAESAFSVVGPYGSGKSSFAVVLDGLLAPAADPSRVAAEDLLRGAAPELVDAIADVHRRHDTDGHGFVRAAVTAQREPVSLTVLRALLHGAERFPPVAGRARKRNQVLTDLHAALHAAEVGQLPAPRLVRGLLADLGRLAPVLLLIDEFGKNLEAFADAPAEADLFLLQELAEWTRGEQALPLVVVTLQHQSFEAYSEGTAPAQRREWAKIQGRFEEVPFVDSPAQTRMLIAAAFRDGPATAQADLPAWADTMAAAAAHAGLAEAAGSSDLLARCYPLHPVTLFVLPELCARYGQNERTLFSFLASREPLSVASFLESGTWALGELPCVGLDRVYDYFVDSVGSLVGVSRVAGRWLEIDTRIRDATGLTDGHRRVLKAVGLLNLVSAGGSLRASRAVVAFAAADGQSGSQDAAAVQQALDDLEAAGLLTFRDFADEYRVWQGSDFDVRSALEQARHRLAQQRPAALLERVKPLPPLVAARHSQISGTLRTFARCWADEATEGLRPPDAVALQDGLLVYLLADDVHPALADVQDGDKPVLVVRSGDRDALIESAREAAAVAEVLDGAQRVAMDHVAQRELIERRAEATHRLDRLVADAFGAYDDRGELTAMTPEGPVPLAGGGAEALSTVADRVYDQAPVIANELLNRAELSSQAAKARRELLEALVTRFTQERLDLEGYGPERAMYEAVLRSTGVHRKEAGGWTIGRPTRDSSLYPAWAAVERRLGRAKGSRLDLEAVYRMLAAPPYGVRMGVAPVLTLAVLVSMRREVAVYEHGTFKPVITGDLVERLLRNPAHFQLKHVATGSAGRKAVLAELGTALRARVPTMSDGPASLLGVVGALVLTYNQLEEHTRKTKLLPEAARAVRDVVRSATEPDVLVFRALPEALGMAPIPASGAWKHDPTRFATQVAEALEALRRHFAGVLEGIVEAVRQATGAPAERWREDLAVRARHLEGKVLDSRMRGFLAALAAEGMGDRDWAEYVGMTVAELPPAAWVDDDLSRFMQQVREMGGTFRRLEALYFERQAHDGEGFEAVRLTLTEADGGEVARVVWVNEGERARLEQILEDAVRNASQGLGSSDRAADALLALLARRGLARSSTQTEDTSGATALRKAAADG